ncbi:MULTISPECIES: type VI secretion system protein TssA [unclassified Duganella]|uniref:type VI secretion system protein TssA n=1 Tax=unclassified Duganella TaxID=2636909 RepID=UPI0006FBB1AD|nr:MULTISPECIES: type VI secretion system protein TssA [unclassified Duganella]KQV61419.1 type VI secretion protein ImpA family [Duganella sp. Root336D2]KRB92491.1 type VI secretion protein ImpA family [Duganella sp. Root198D2]
MKAIPDFLVSASEQQLLDQLLAPVSQDAPCGPPARDDSAFTEIRLLREEDDPSLPMGHWDRPLKYADWDQVAQRCGTMLATRSKDLQLAVWLAEAWMRQRGFVGLLHGLRLLDALLRSYWPVLHPLIEDDGDCDARLASLEWLNDSLSVSVRVQAPLLMLEGFKPPRATLADWERMATAREAGADAPGGEPVATRADVLAAGAAQGAQMAVTRAAVLHSLDYLHSMSAMLHDQLQEQSPKLGKLQGALEAVQRVLQQLQPEQRESVAAAAAGEAPQAPAAETAPEPAPKQEPIVVGQWRDRNEAYVTLDALADYLVAVEPHSPTPFLLRRAARWGRMPLPEVLAEVMQEEGDLNRLMNVIGIKF